jgi:thiol-disulfide isomerase/thioredoxin
MNRMMLIAALAVCACGAGQGGQPATGALSTAERPSVHAPPAPAAPEERPAVVSEHRGKPMRAPLYDERADARQQIAAALAEAGKDGRRVLIQWGGNWCPWCHALHERFEDASIAEELRDRYELVLVDAGAEGKNIDVAASYGADLQKGGYPYLTVLDSSGKPVANQETGALERKGADGKSSMALGHDPEKVLAFLKANEAPRGRAADAVLDEGIAAAKASGKLVFLHFGAPWCKWCDKLDAWLSRDEVGALLAKDYQLVKIDEDTMAGGREVFERFRKGGDKAGLPWFAIVDPATGTALATSEGPKGNIGFPTGEGDFDHLTGMFKKTAKKLSAADLRKLRATLVR